jgi:hypothetical protein
VPGWMDSMVETGLTMLPSHVALREGRRVECPRRDLPRFPFEHRLAIVLRLDDAHSQ